MRYRLMASYRGVPYEAGIGPSDTDVVIFAACPPPEELGFEPATGHWRKQLSRSEVDAVWESRPVGVFRGEPCIVLDDLGERLHITYVGRDATRASRLGYWQVDRGVFELLAKREDVTGLTEERVESSPAAPDTTAVLYPLADLNVTFPTPDTQTAYAAPDPYAETAQARAEADTAYVPRDASTPFSPPEHNEAAGHGFPDVAQPPPAPGAPAGDRLAVTAAADVPGVPSTFPAPLPGQTPLTDASLAVPLSPTSTHEPAPPFPGIPPEGAPASPAPTPQAAAPTSAEDAPRYPASTLEAGPAVGGTSLASGYPGGPNGAPSHVPPGTHRPGRDHEPAGGSPETRRRAARRQRVSTREIFSGLTDLAAIPRAAYALEAEVDGALCLLTAGDGFEVFVAADGARHEVRSFTDEEAAYFYLFGVLAAEAVRNGSLAPVRISDASHESS